MLKLLVDLAQRREDLTGLLKLKEEIIQVLEDADT
jgi:hypothetical protein